MGWRDQHNPSRGEAGSYDEEENMTLPKYRGVAWYHSAADYALLKHISADTRDLPESFEEWIKQAEESVSLFTTEGWIVEKVYLDPVEFPAWCRALGMKINSVARIEFVTAVVARKYADVL
jgi:hypothetical protein